MSGSKDVVMKSIEEVKGIVDLPAKRKRGIGSIYNRT